MMFDHEEAECAAKAHALVGKMVLVENNHGGMELVYVTWPLAVKLAKEGYGIADDV